MLCQQLDRLKMAKPHTGGVLRAIFQKKRIKTLYTE